MLSFRCYTVEPGTRWEFCNPLATNPAPPPPPPPTSGRYIGCYKDSRGHGNGLRHSFGGRQSRKSCRKACMNANYKYFGLQWTNECFCGTGYGSETSNSCACPASADQTSGNVGGWVNCVYEVHKSEGRSQANPTPPPTKPCNGDGGDLYAGNTPDTCCSGLTPCTEPRPRSDPHFQQWPNIVRCRKQCQ